MSLHEVWKAAASSPFEPSVGKSSQLYVGFILLLLGKPEIRQQLEPQRILTSDQDFYSPVSLALVRFDTSELLPHADCHQTAL
jgi:hypothetical protein